ncbi:MAG: mannose-1-phosphate guanylyltransferase [Treponema sp.]|jgi:mannose-1-phosphate guanylyltransferase/mannose-6-phosphate isomerase|nr:mannose-1-phosphate guanylyltransferase [Treponema sp.]
MFDDCIIMAGGFGTRLWPASSSRLPKQFLPAGDRSFFSAALDRALSVIDRNGRVIIIAGKSHVSHIVKACRDYPPEDLNRFLLIPEPEAKSTAPAIACAAMYADWMAGKERKMLALTSDHIIEPVEKFKIDAAAAEAFAQADKLAVFGIVPTRPETGYGYIEAGTLLSAKAEDPKVYGVASFREKPGGEQAERFVEAGNFYWNSGMFAFSSKFILDEFRQKAPRVILPFGKLRAPDERSLRIEHGLRILWEWRDLDKAYRDAEAVSFDYAIAEKCSQTIMVRAGFNWTDMGSWDEYAALTGTGEGDVTRSKDTEVFQTGSKNCFVDSDIPVALIGAEDLVVAVRSGKNGENGAVLIAKRGETQKMREIVEQIKSAGRQELL